MNRLHIGPAVGREVMPRMLRNNLWQAISMVAIERSFDGLMSLIPYGVFSIQLPPRVHFSLTAELLNESGITERSYQRRPGTRSE